MTSSRKYAEKAAAALGKVLRDGADSGKVADFVEAVLADATREREKEERQHLAEVETAAATRLSRLLDASPAVIYSFEAKGDFSATFISENITRPLPHRNQIQVTSPNSGKRIVPDHAI